ncbi:MAG: SHD1 domain-containing protein [Thermoguttaceae bacterium]|jgi:hypothetical protein
MWTNARTVLITLFVGGAVVMPAFGQRTVHRTPAAKPAPQPVSLWRDSHKGDLGALGGRIEGRNVLSAWSFKVERIIDEDTAEIHSAVILEMTPQELQDNHASAGQVTVRWEFRLKSAAVVKDLHEGQSLAKIPGTFRHEGRKFEYGHSIDLVGQAPAKAAPGPAADAFRTWTDNKGRAVEAKLVDQQIVLKRRDGTEITVPLSKLSEEDRKWVRDLNR